jgi:hypothetical protein
VLASAVHNNAIQHVFRAEGNRVNVYVPLGRYFYYLSEGS